MTDEEKQVWEQTRPFVRAIVRAVVAKDWAVVRNLWKALKTIDEATANMFASVATADRRRA